MRWPRETALRGEGPQIGLPGTPTFNQNAELGALPEEQESSQRSQGVNQEG